MSPFEQNLQRTLNAVAMKPLDKIPCSFNGPAYMAKRQGLTLSEYLRDPRKAANAAIAFCKAHPGVDSIHSPAMNVHTLPVLWLSEVAVPGVDLSEDKLWQVHEKEKMPLRTIRRSSTVAILAGFSNTCMMKSATRCPGCLPTRSNPCG